jgi:hypothetical protein
VQLAIEFNPTVPDEAKPRLNNQHRSILARLSRGPATNRELNQIAQRFNARICEIRAAGVRVDKRLVDARKGVYEYRLVAEGGS